MRREIDLTRYGSTAAIQLSTLKKEDAAAAATTDKKASGRAPLANVINRSQVLTSKKSVRLPPAAGFTEIIPAAAGAKPKSSARVYRQESKVTVEGAPKRELFARASVAFIDNRLNSSLPEGYLVKYIDVQTGDTVQFPSTKLVDIKRYRKLVGSKIALDESRLNSGGTVVRGLNQNKGSYRDLQSYTEVEPLGWFWRFFLRALIQFTRDEPNALRLTRGLQPTAQFLTAYECNLISEMIRGFHSHDEKEVKEILTLTFQNRNASRIVVQQLARYDFLFHTYTHFKYNRWFEMLGSVPILSWYIPFAFPATENFPNTRTFALNSFFRQVLGTGYWWTRVLTNNRQALLTDDPNVISQNLAAEGNGFEANNRNQHGTFLGREITNEFRRTHRLPTDESIVRTFVAQPIATTVNNGIEHTVRQLARHWHNMLYQPWGNFAHQRGEQLIPFEFLRFHIPPLLAVLVAFRGPSRWDAEVLAPYIEKLQNIIPIDDIKSTRQLVKEFMDEMLVNVCGAIASRVDAVRSLFDAIDQALVGIEEKSVDVKAIVENVQFGIDLGIALVNHTNWVVPSIPVLRKAVNDVCLSIAHPERAPRNAPEVDPVFVKRSLNLLSSKDKRTLIELCREGLQSSHACVLLMTRTVTLLQRELRRNALDSKLLEESKGKKVPSPLSCVVQKAYWIDNHGVLGVFVYLGPREVKKEGKAKSSEVFVFIHRAARHEFVVEAESFDDISIFEYVEYAETITRAQKAFMVIELDHQRQYSYAALGEFKWMRDALRDLVLVCALNCYVLDDARLNVLQSIQQGSQTHRTVNDLIPNQTYYILEPTTRQYEPFVCTKKYTSGDPDFESVKTKQILICPPQNVIVIGGGPTGLLGAIHMAENVLFSDGKIKLWESRDAFTQGGATFERSQIVRLDARWIAMMRYHLGTVYEDVFIPASCETSSHYGNVLPPQGFIEITIKDMENMLNIHVAKMASRGLVEHISNSGAAYDPSLNRVIKQGKALKVDDLILRKFDQSGNACSEDVTWKVAELVRAERLEVSELELNKDYAIYDTHLKKIVPYKLVGVNLVVGEYTFKSLESTVSDVVANAKSFPSVYSAGTKQHDEVRSIILECLIRNQNKTYAREKLVFSEVERQNFIVDTERAHIAEAIGKPHDSPVHISFTTEEPYGVCCLSGLKVSMGMHNFGTRRWTTGIIDDLRSHTDQNTRVIGDFTKIVNSSKIVEKMSSFLAREKDWRLHYEKLVADFGYGQQLKDIYSQLTNFVNQLNGLAPFRRRHLQTRFFETGDNFYLGMEFTREYDEWKQNLSATIVAPLKQNASSDKEKKQVSSFKGALEHHIDRLWYYGALETIRLADVYNPGGRSKVPHLYLIDSYTDVKLGTIPVGDCFQIVSDPTLRLEVMFHYGGKVVVRNHEGYISRLSPNTIVKRSGNLTRGPDGLSESKVAMATFPVSHYVNYRAMRLSPSSLGYVYAALGDQQASPHFMRYSGLTGAAINVMSYNNFLAAAIDGVSFTDRFQDYINETNWSNGEVVQRGTGANYGEDGFLRPGFPYEEGIKFMYSKAVEHYETHQDMDDIFSRDWKVKFAAAYIPVGMEFNDIYCNKVIENVQMSIFENFLSEAASDKLLSLPSDFVEVMKRRPLWTKEINPQFSSWLLETIEDLAAPAETKQRLEHFHIYIAVCLDIAFSEIVETARSQSQNNLRITSQMYNQPLPVDTLYDDFHAEAQGALAALAHVATMTSLALALQFVTNIGAIIATAVSFWIATGTSTNSSRYKNRNEAWRVRFSDMKYDEVLATLYDCLSKANRDAVPNENNPYFRILDKRVKKFIENVKYYNYPDPREFHSAYESLKVNMHNPRAIKDFMTLVTSKFLPDTYFVNSYLQQNLVEVYAALSMAHDGESNDNKAPDSATAAAKVLFERFLLFKERLEVSLQRGKIVYGAFQQRKVKHNHCFTLINYFWIKVWTAFCGRYQKTGCFALPQTIDEVKKVTAPTVKPVIVETEEIFYQMKYLNESFESPALRRSIMDVESLFLATRESILTSFVIISGIISFFTGIVFTVGNIGLAADDSQEWAQNLTLAGSYSFGIATVIPSFVATTLILRMFRIQILTDSALTKKLGETEDEEAASHLTHIRLITRVQATLNLIRSFGTTLSCIALPWALAARTGLESNFTRPFGIAIASASINSFVVVCLYILDLTLLYDLSTNLGEYICVAFDDELSELKESLTLPSNTLETEHVQQRRTWEYVAKAFLHVYRFDTVFLQNRFGSILQYVQSGLKRSVTVSVPGVESKKVQKQPKSLGNIDTVY